MDEIEADPFDAPATGEFFDKAAIHAAMGQLLAVVVTGYEDHVPTVHTKPGEKSPCVKCGIYVLTGDDADADDRGYVSYEDSMIFQKVLIGNLKSKVGKIVLGRLTQGVEKQGKNAPWMLTDASDADKVIGRAWHAKYLKAADPFTPAS
jgi:hypothetical protein